MNSGSHPPQTARVDADRTRGPLETRRYVDDAIRPALERVDGVGSVTVLGGAEREVRVELQRQAIELARLSRMNTELSMTFTSDMPSGSAASSSSTASLTPSTIGSKEAIFAALLERVHQANLAVLDEPVPSGLTFAQRLELITMIANTPPRISASSRMFELEVDAGQAAADVRDRIAGMCPALFQCDLCERCELAISQCEAPEIVEELQKLRVCN